jgi:hypothetical protein
MSSYPSSIRWSEEDMALIRSLEASTGLERTEVLRLSLRVLHRALELLPALAASAVPEELKKRKKK